ncbi:hypothetical protein, partial [Pseudomonas atacamensis]|uniref:hypothetical protein n=1 Tax=Pseudomonas atacamensis TaxID=2565368 RepID=UPI002B1E01EC
TGSLNLGSFSFTTTDGCSAGTLYSLDATPSGALAASAFWYDTTKYGIFATSDDIGVFNITQTSGINVKATGGIEITSGNTEKITLTPATG